MGQDYLGVYATSETASSLGDFPRPLGKRKRLWFVWMTPEGGYSVQALNAACEPMASPRMIGAEEFHKRYAPEPECPVVPEGYVKSGESDDSAVYLPLPDLFFADSSQARPPLLQDSNDGKEYFSADNPALLRNWVKSHPQRMQQVLDPVKIPFDRLVAETERNGEVTEGRAQSGAAVQPGASAQTPVAPVSFTNGKCAQSVGTMQPEESMQPEEARLLRSKFVQALLLLRRGKREEAVLLLQDMLGKAYPDFPGAAQLFSEFGLGLRRLGFIKLALSAHRRAKTYAPQDERVLFNIARSYHDLGLLEEAREYLEKALAISPEFASAKQFLAFLNSERQ